MFCMFKHSKCFDKKNKVKYIFSFFLNKFFLEPGLFVCWYCKEDQSSAWDLIKHVQKVHGIKCYSEPENKPPHSPPITTTSAITSRIDGVENLTLSHSRRRSRSPDPPKAKTMKFDGIGFGEDKKADLPAAFPTGKHMFLF